MSYEVARRFALLTHSDERVASLLARLDAKSHESSTHSTRVASHAITLGVTLGLTEDELRGLNLGAVLHDVGKLDPDITGAILHKTSRLDPGEWERMAKHPERGAVLVSGLDLPADAVSAISYHHERWDGGGYPLGLSGLDIPLTARIVSLVDTYDTIISKRAYEGPRRVTEAISEIERCAGKQFDPTLAPIYLRLLRRKHAHTLERYLALAS